MLLGMGLSIQPLLPCLMLFRTRLRSTESTSLPATKSSALSREPWC